MADSHRVLRPFFSEQQAHLLQGVPLEQPRTEAFKRLLHAAGVGTVRATEWPPPSSGRGSGIDWLFTAARAHEAQNGLSCSSPGLSILGGALDSGHPWDMTRLEDVVDDGILFGRVEAQRRKNSSYRAAAAKLHDLHIVLPIIVPGGSLIVESVQGANFYRFPATERGANLLFGKGVEDNDNSTNKQSPAAVASAAAEAAAAADAAAATTTTPVKGGNAADLGDDEEECRPVCDVWASFLHIRLGSIYNLTPDQVGLVSDLFRSATFDLDLCRFYVPIAVDCRGVYPAKDEDDGRRGRGAGARYRFSVKEKYETRGVPSSDNDLKRLRMLRRHLRRLALRCITEFGFNADAPGPSPRIEFHDNLRIDTLLKGTLRIVVREWSPLTHAPTFRRIWARKFSEENAEQRRNAFSAEVESRVLQQKAIPTARVLTGEVRLEHSHLRMIDPRWPNDLVPGRRLADRCPEAEAPGPEGTLGRFVFCKQLPLPPVEYAYVKPGEDPRGVVITSKLQTLYKVHLSRHPHAGWTSAARAATTTSATEGDATTTTTSGALDAVAAPFVPLLRSEIEATSAALPASLRRAVLGHCEEPAPTDLSAVDPAAPASPPSFHLCKFYLGKLGCARGSACKFWHPADSYMTSLLDVRQVTPQHPKFF